MQSDLVELNLAANAYVDLWHMVVFPQPHGVLRPHRVRIYARCQPHMCSHAASESINMHKAPKRPSSHDPVAWAARFAFSVSVSSGVYDSLRVVVHGAM